MSETCDETCEWCGEPIDPAEPVSTMLALVPGQAAQFVARHPACARRAVVGGVNHLRGTCTCCGGTEPPDPPGLSRREAARLACELWEQHHDARRPQRRPAGPRRRSAPPHQGDAG